MVIVKITPSVVYNWWLERLDTQLNKPTNQNSLKVPNFVHQRIRKRYYKTLGTSVIPAQCPSLSLLYYTFLYFPASTLPVNDLQQ